MAAPVVPESQRLSGLHLLLTYECNFECDHCFVWGGPAQKGTMSPETIEDILRQAVELGTIEWIYFEGGEPFLHYPLLRSGVLMAREHGFRIGIVTNGYWATDEAEARAKLEPFAGILDDLSISDDAYHGSGDGEQHTHLARRAAEELGIPVDFICVAGPGASAVQNASGQLPAGESAVMYRGRAAHMLACRVRGIPWKRFTECPGEDLRRPERVHVDAYGHLHVCQGISIGNLLERRLADILRDYEPDDHPVVGPLLAGGPAELVNHYGLPRQRACADACHLCYLARCELRSRFPEVLTPGQMYGPG